MAERNDPPEGKSESAKRKNAARREQIYAARQALARWEAEVASVLNAQIVEAWQAFELRRVSWEAQQLAVNYKIQAGGSDDPQSGNPS